MTPRRLARLTATLLIAVPLLLTSACGKKSKAPDPPRFDPEAIVAAKAPINLLDKKLKKQVGAELVDAGRMEDGRLHVRVNLRNGTKKPLDLEARCVYKDPSGMSTGDETEWQRLFFAPQQIQTIEFTSRLPQSTTYTVEVRKP